MLGSLRFESLEDLTAHFDVVVLRPKGPGRSNRHVWHADRGPPESHAVGAAV